MTTRLAHCALFVLAALTVVLVQGPAVGSLPGKVAGSAPTRLSTDARAATPCPPGEAAGRPGEWIESHGLLIRLEEAELWVGARSLEASVTTSAGEPVVGAMVFMTVQMPAMDHGVSAYPAQESGEGRYRARDVSLGMAGEWVVTVQVVRQGRAPATTAFAVNVTGE